MPTPLCNGSSLEVQLFNHGHMQPYTHCNHSNLLPHQTPLLFSFGFAQPLSLGSDLKKTREKEQRAERKAAPTVGQALSCFRSS